MTIHYIYPDDTYERGNPVQSYVPLECQPKKKKYIFRHSTGFIIHTEEFEDTKDRQHNEKRTSNDLKTLQKH